MARSQVQYGSTGVAVKELQQILNKSGYNLSEDGIFGSKTQAAVKDYQWKNGLSADGIVGLKTWDSLSKGMASPSTPTAPKPTAAPTAKPMPSAPLYDTTTWGETDKGKESWDAYQDAQNALNNHGNFQYANQAQLDAIMQSILGRDKFSFDFNQDAFYHQYKDKFVKQGKMAMQDTMGQAAAMTGGYGNSYAATAGNQAYQASLEQLNDVIPELYQMAYDRYQQEGQDLYNQYGLLQSDYDRAYGEHNDEYNRLMDALGVARSDYYDGADMHYTEQSNQNGIKGQTFNDAMSLWQSENDNAWKQAEWDESLRQRAEDIAYRDARDKVADEQWQKQFDAVYGNKSTGGSGGSGGSGSGGGSGNETTSTGSTSKTGGVTSDMRKKASEFTNNDNLANWAYGLADSGAISNDEADALIAEFMDSNEVYKENEDGSKSISYSDMVKSTKGWKVVSKGGGNLVGIDNNAKVESPNGEVIRLDQLKKKLIAEGMKDKDATNYIKKLQQNLGISSNWLFGL